MFETLKQQIAANPDNAILWMLLIITFLVSLFLMIKWQLTPDNGFDLKDLICTNGRLSSSKVARFGAFIVSTWCFIYLTANDKLSEWYFMGYMAAWVSNALFSRYITDQDRSAKSKSRQKPSESASNSE